MLHELNADAHLSKSHEIRTKPKPATRTLMSEAKISALAKRFPAIPEDQLALELAACGGDVEKTTQLLEHAIDVSHFVLLCFFLSFFLLKNTFDWVREACTTIQ
jgi:hypothetical protein